eukprot:gene29131-35582_t
MTDQDTSLFQMTLLHRAASVETLLTGLLSDQPQDGEISRPPRLMAAMRHGVLNGGKRLRPFLVLESAALFGADTPAALRVAAALECIHSYSLVHDDLPAMDNDDMRRGQPTVHRKFDEAAAILAGDSLLTYAFELIAAEATELDAGAKVALVTALARAAGVGGMTGGQALDLEAEKVKPDEAGIIRLQAMKTGALIRFACEAGAMIGNANSADPTGKDAAAGKATLVSLHGIDWTKRQLSGLVAQAEELLAPFGEKAALLKQAARFIAERQS